MAHNTCLWRHQRDCGYVRMQFRGRNQVGLVVMERSWFEEAWGCSFCRVFSFILLLLSQLYVWCSLCIAAFSLQTRGKLLMSWLMWRKLLSQWTCSHWLVDERLTSFISAVKVTIILWALFLSDGVIFLSRGFHDIRHGISEDLFQLF